MIPFINTAFVRRIYRVSPLIVLLLAAYLRFYRIDYQSLWNDEGNSLRLAQRSVPALVEAASHDIHPPGYYLALKGWISITGETEFALRLLSALAGVLTVACVYALGKSLFAPGAGLLAALIVTVNAFSVYYGQEARMYAPLALIAAASMLVFVRWIACPTWRLGVALALLNAAGLYTQYTFPLVMVTQGVLFVVWIIMQRSMAQRAAPLQYVVLNLLTIALFLPQISTALTQVRSWPRPGETVVPVDGLATVARWIIFGNTSNMLPWWAYVWPALFALAALLPDWTRRPLPFGWRRLVPVLWLLIAVVPLFALGLFREANLKFLLPAQIAMALLIGRGAWLLWEIGSPNLFILTESLPRIAAGLGLLWIGTASSEALNNLYQAEVYARPDYRAMARLIRDNPRPDDAIILDAPNQQEVFTYYYRGNAPVYPLPEGLGGDDAKTAAAVNAIIDQHRRIFVLYWGETERDPNRVVQKTLAARAFEASSNWYGDVRFVQYATLPQSVGISTGIAARFGDSITLHDVTLSATTVQAGDVLGVTFTWSTAQPLTHRYKVFVQLLNAQGQLVAQHDSEPGNNLAITTAWQPGQSITDAHGLLIPPYLPPGDYRLIFGLYDLNDPQARLTVNNQDHLDLGMIQISR
ncbi:MAG: glycosyltransferase family 39 protein [Anaerolineae bacterium]|nr:glycosyltransferase family 39 protein [Anaerolineae bacterium]